MFLSDFLDSWLREGRNLLPPLAFDATPPPLPLQRHIYALTNLPSPEIPSVISSVTNFMAEKSNALLQSNNEDSGERICLWRTRTG